MNQLIRTETGSVYEHDPEDGSIRRLEGSMQPTPRQGRDGEWKRYETIVGPVIGQPMCIVWMFDDAGGIPIGRSTITSFVVSIDQIRGDAS